MDKQTINLNEYSVEVSPYTPEHSSEVACSVWITCPGRPTLHMMFGRDRAYYAYEANYGSPLRFFHEVMLCHEARGTFATEEGVKTGRGNLWARFEPWLVTDKLMECIEEMQCLACIEGCTDADLRSVMESHGLQDVPLKLYFNTIDRPERRSDG